MSFTTDKDDPRLRRGPGNAAREGQDEVYLVLPEEERAKGWVRPYRVSYIHVGRKPRFPLRDLTDEEKNRHGDGYVKYEEYPESESPLVGRAWTQKQLDNKSCGAMTIMGRALAETYARDPNFYGRTYCAACKVHLPVDEFVWKDGSVVGS